MIIMIMKYVKNGIHTPYGRECRRYIGGFLPLRVTDSRSRIWPWLLKACFFRSKAVRPVCPHLAPRFLLNCPRRTPLFQEMEKPCSSPSFCAPSVLISRPFFFIPLPSEQRMIIIMMNQESSPLYVSLGALFAGVGDLHVVHTGVPRS